MKFTQEALDNLAVLSRLKLKTEDKEKLVEQMDSIIGYVGEINSLDLNVVGQADKTHVNIFKGDEVTTISSAENTKHIIGNSKDTLGDYVKVSQVIKQ
jgi:aspartyl/glutamyl-tRNA(Asn/Gln) amidotransferase C subunit